MRSVSARRRVSAILLLAMMLVTACAYGGRGDSVTPQGPGDPAIVNTGTGAVRGVVAADHRLFAGIPYAAPPVGPLRWQLPAPARPWQGVRDATHTGSRCIQDTSDLELGRQTSEDCLTLNVWTPPASERKRAVMVWIHGGAFVSGSSRIYDSRWLVSRGDVVVVTMNYRLGALGFLAHPSLGPAGAVGNYGLADQQAALRWVHDNIANFGGDPDAVTIAGESAGGMSVCDHLVAPGSAGLFRAAIIQSGPCQAQLALPDAEKASVDYARDAGCGDPAAAASCLRALPAEKLRKPLWLFRIGDDGLSGPVTGTTVLPVDPMVAIAAGRDAKVPVLIGSNRDEFTLFVAIQYLRQKPYDDAQYPQLLAETFGRDAQAIAARYPLAQYGGSVPLAYSAAVTDGAFACVADRITEGLAKTGPVFAYEFNDRAAVAPEALRRLPFPVGASHSLELRYLFDIGGAPRLDPDQQVLSDQMIDTWTKFVSDGNPGEVWPAFGGDGKRLSLRPDGSRVETDFDQIHQCPFWAGVDG